MIISVDAGKHTTKAILATAGEKRIFAIRTKLEEQGIMLNQDGKSFAVEYENKKYIIGEAAQITDYETCKTKLCHKISTYVAIIKLGVGDNLIDIVTGCPISQFRNKELREEYAQYIQDRNIQIKINRDTHKFTINSVMVLPESIGVVAENIPEFMDNLVGVIDIGGLNTNAAIYENMRPLPSSVFTVIEGGEILNSKIRRALNTALMTNYQDYEIAYLRPEGKEKEIVDEILNAQMEIILALCKQFNWNLKKIPIVFTGGGSQILEKQIKQMHNARISRNPVWDNASGFLRLKEMYRK